MVCLNAIFSQPKRFQESKMIGSAIVRLTLLVGKISLLVISVLILSWFAIGIFSMIPASIMLLGILSLILSSGYIIFRIIIYCFSYFGKSQVADKDSRIAQKGILQRILIRIYSLVKLVIIIIIGTAIARFLYIISPM